MGRNWVGSFTARYLSCWPVDSVLEPSSRNTIIPYISRPELRQEHPLNLSISISGGKETNKDSPSNGE